MEEGAGGREAYSCSFYKGFFSECAVLVVELNRKVKNEIKRVTEYLIKAIKLLISMKSSFKIKKMVGQKRYMAESAPPPLS